MIVAEGESDDQVGWGWGGGRERQTGRQVARGFALEGTVWMGVTAMLNLLYRFFSSCFFSFPSNCVSSCVLVVVSENLL